MAYKNWNETYPTGKAAEEAGIAAFAEMGLVPICTAKTADTVEHVDVFVTNPGPEFEPQGGFHPLIPYYVEAATPPWYMCIDFKSANKFPTINNLKRCREKILVEWCSGSDEYATPLSDEDSLVTHLAFMPPRADGGWWDRPFFLFAVDHLREFYLKYNDGSGRFISACKDTRNAHCALLDARQYLSEYSFAYFNKADGVWNVTEYGNADKGALNYCLLPPLGMVYSALFDQKHRVEAALSGHREPGVFLKLCQMDEQQTANVFFGGDMVKYAYADMPHHFDEKYRFKRPSR